MSGVTVSDDGRLRFDGLETRLSSPLAAGSSQIFFEDPLVHSGNVAVGTIPAEVDGIDYLPLSILDTSNRLREIVHLTDYVQGANSGTIVRGQEGTTDVEHIQNAKVVHSATVQDFLNTQDHMDDDQAHAAVINALVAEGLADHLGDHENPDPLADPHTQYIRKDDSEITTTTITGSLTIADGADLIVNGDLTVNGRLLINGYEIVISANKPASQPSNLLWIRPVS